MTEPERDGIFFAPRARDSDTPAIEAQSPPPPPPPPPVRARWVSLKEVRFHPDDPHTQAVTVRDLTTGGMTAPSTLSGRAYLYVDTADGDLKVKFGDGTVKTIVVDT